MDISDDPGILFNISEDIIVKKKPVNKDKNKNIGEKLFSSLQTSKNQKFISKEKSPVKQFQYKEKGANHLSNKSGLEHVRSSSLFKSNPEIPSLNVCLQKGVSEPLFSKKTFEDINLHPHLVSCLNNRLKVVKLTKVQEESIPVLLQGNDCLIKSCTGSGKTLAYAIPIVQKLQEVTPKIKRNDGIFSLIIVPTRELALQCFECFSELTNAFRWLVPGYLIGGEKKKAEKARLRKGINILISTPGRLLDHLERTACLTLEKIQWLVIDEADKLLEEGFEESVNMIVSKCRKSRQTVLLSATLSNGVERLAGMTLTNPAHVDVASETGKVPNEFKEFALPSGLKQSVVVVPSKLRLTVMSAFIIDNILRTGFKGLIFMCSQNSVDFHFSLLSGVLSPVLKCKGHKCKFFKLHGNMKQEERTEIFTTFRSKSHGILLCTDVAARGIDIPHVDWIMQYSAPPSAEIYVHRVGRTARIGKKGSALLFLLPSEDKFSGLLSEHKIQFEGIDASKILQSLLLVSDVLSCRPKMTAEDCATALQTQFEKKIYSEETLHDSAKQAFKSYVHSYASYPKNIRHVLPFKALHLGHIAKSFCLREAPSELGCHINSGNYQKPFRRNDDKKAQKRKHTATISEFDSGLSSITHAPKRKYTATISEYDSGLSSLTQSGGLKSKKRKYR